MKNCKLCGKPAKWIEWSPDGKPDYFCTKKHYEINRNYFHAKGIAWRALPLRRLTKEENN